MSINIEELEAKLNKYKEIANKVGELEHQRKQIGKELLQSFPTDLKKYATPNFRVSKQRRVNVKTTLDDARQLRSTKIEETIDKDKLLLLHETGQRVPGITVTEFVQVKKITS